MAAGAGFVQDPDLPVKCVHVAFGNCVTQTYGSSTREFISPVVSTDSSRADFANGGAQTGFCSDDPVIKPGTERCPDQALSPYP